MARPLKQGVDYFPLDVSMDDKFELIEAVHGVAGFGIVIKLYQKIYEYGYFLHVDERVVLVLSKRINVDINLINAVINDCVKWRIFDPGVYEKYQILTSRGIQRRYFEIVKRRKEVHVDERTLLIAHNLPEEATKLVNVNNNSVNGDINPVNACDGTQIEIEREIERESKKKSAFSPEFESFWKTYPKRNGRKIGKEKAALMFKKIPVKDLEDLKLAVSNYSQECNGLPKDAERFLRNGFWKDYLKPRDPAEKKAANNQKDNGTFAETWEEMKKETKEDGG